MIEFSISKSCTGCTAQRKLKISTSVSQCQKMATTHPVVNIHTVHVMCGGKTTVCARMQETFRKCNFCATGNSNLWKTQTLLKIRQIVYYSQEKTKLAQQPEHREKPTVLSSMNLSLRGDPDQACFCVVHRQSSGKILMIFTMTELFKSHTTQVQLKTTVMFITDEQHNKLLSINETNTDSRKV